MADNEYTYWRLGGVARSSEVPKGVTACGLSPEPKCPYVLGCRVLPQRLATGILENNALML